ncbi:MAG TPA: hypothetical protein VGF95_02910 [Solirubrobacteraceae bacterium]
MSRLRSALKVVGSLCVLLVSAPGVAGAYATDEPPPSSSTAAGLPDSRVYEEVSPANKHGFEAGATLGSENEVAVQFSVASPDGDAVAFGASGPAAETDASGLSRSFVAERTSEGWKSRSTTARGLDQTEGLSLAFQQPSWLDYSPDLSHLVYGTLGPQVQGAPAQSAGNIYLMGSDPFEKPTWLFEEGSGGAQGGFGVDLLGMSPDASVIYVAFERNLLPQDTGRSGWGVYEYRGGKLGEAGVLPDGSVPPAGALPAATASIVQENEDVYDASNPASLDNEVSEDGMRMFFVAGGELYVHEITNDGERSVLVSASQVAGHTGEAAPDGVQLFENLTQRLSGKTSEASAPTYAYASSDGSHVFFQSEDKLTDDAPNASGPKVYVFDVDTGSLEYLPGVTLGGIVTAAADGSSFMFVNDAATPELSRWVAGPDGGSVSPIVKLPGGGFVGPGRLVGDDSTFVFQASAPIEGFNNAGTEQIYRYDINTNELGCLSCPPVGVTPTGDAYLSAVDQFGDPDGRSLGEDREVNDARGVSADGEQVFFDSPDPLVGRDTNGQRDVYEWENGTVYLISSGTSSVYSLFLDNSESGGDVFFATSDELVEGDNDQGFDVYDARVPRPSDNPPPAAVPCEGDVCQGPPIIAELLGSPPSATFNGTENLVTEAEAVGHAKNVVRRLTRAQKLARALTACRKRKAKHGRSACKRRARRQYRAVPAVAKHNSGRGK